VDFSGVISLYLPLIIYKFKTKKATVQHDSFSLYIGL
jgi:hypothetical protein